MRRNSRKYFLITVYNLVVFPTQASEFIQDSSELLRIAFTFGVNYTQQKILESKLKKIMVSAIQSGHIWNANRAYSESNFEKINYLLDQSTHPESSPAIFSLCREFINKIPNDGINIHYWLNNRPTPDQQKQIFLNRMLNATVTRIHKKRHKYMLLLKTDGYDHHFKKIKKLLEAGADPQAVNCEKQEFLNTMLQTVVARECFDRNNPTVCNRDTTWDQIKYWVKQGADQNCQLLSIHSSFCNKKCLTYFDQAIHESRHDLVEFFIQNGCRVDTHDYMFRYPLYFLMMDHANSRIFFFSSTGQAYSSIPKKETPERVRIMKLLLAHGANPNLLIRDRLPTPLGAALDNKHQEYIKLLLQYVTDPTEELYWMSIKVQVYEPGAMDFFLKAFRQLTDAKASWDFRSIEISHHPTFLHVVYYYHRCFMSEFLKYAPIYFLLKENSAEDYPPKGEMRLLDKSEVPLYSANCNQVQELLFDKKIPLPIALSILEELLPLNEILLHNRPADMTTKYPVIIKFLQESIIKINAMLNIPVSQNGPSLAESEKINYMSEGEKSIIALLDGTRLADDYQKFITGSCTGSLREDNIVNAMYNNTIEFLKKRFQAEYLID